MRRGSGLLFVLFVAVVVGAGVVLGIDNRRSEVEAKRGEEFQRLVGGLGFGAARDLRRCIFAFDPRLDSACSEDAGPIPGGSVFCPYHACSIRDYPPEQGHFGDAQVP
jgi:hypothetical protein